MITLAVDAMGGDAGLEVTVPGAIAFLQQKTDVRLMMVGDESTTGAATVCSTITVGCVSSISCSSLASISSNTGGEKAKS